MNIQNGWLVTSTKIYIKLKEIQMLRYVPASPTILLNMPTQEPKPALLLLLIGNQAFQLDGPEAEEAYPQLLANLGIAHA